MVTREAVTPNRGQLLIVGAVGLAVVLIALTLALNTAVYADVYVGHSGDERHDEREIVRLHEDVERGITGAIFAGPVSDRGYDDLKTGVEAEVALLDDNLSHHAALDGKEVTVDAKEVRIVSHITQNETNEFRPYDDDQAHQWTLVERTDAVHAFNMTFDNLSVSHQCEGNHCFDLIVNGNEDDTWTLQAVTNADGEKQISITTSDGEVSTHEQTASNVSIDLIEGNISDGDESSTFTPFVDDLDGADGYTIEFASGNNGSSGTYNLTVEGKAEEDNFAVGEPDASPRVEPEVVEVSVVVDVHSPRVSVLTEFVIMAGDDDG